MGAFVSWLLVILAGLLAIPTTVLCLEIVAGLVRRQVPTSPGRGAGRRIAVLVPAHNESVAIAATLEDIKAQLRPGDRLLVVADNCTDDTAAVAGLSGAEVVKRQDSERIGKGYALDWGLRHLDKDPPDVVIVIDADCRLSERSIARLTGACSVTGRPVQALDLMTAPAGSGINKLIAEFAWRVKNWVRPLGLAGLGLPCQMAGTGMAIPWPVIRAADLASGWIVEDLKLGLDLAAAGHPPLFCPSARVTSQFAASAGGADMQRSRWEHGHIKTILKLTPRMLCMAIARANFSLLVLTLDLAVPPLSLLAMLLIATCATTTVAAWFDLGLTALIISSGCLFCLATTVGLAWNKYGRDVLPARAVLSVPLYVLAKLGLYRQVLFGKMTTQWVRTDRALDAAVLLAEQRFIDMKGMLEVMRAHNAARQAQAEGEAPTRQSAQQRPEAKQQVLTDEPVRRPSRLAG
ncbi:MAG: glycosyltransferase family 2 protein [Terriglobales bacterium]|jgi:cellulose synthase/poly-beta-1,6-N-acetylglucosamine synthase-like glycosyltransferase